MDDMFMEGRTKGILLSVTAKDGNNGLFPVAFATVSAENTNNWVWFLGKLLIRIEEYVVATWKGEKKARCGLVLYALARKIFGMNWPTLVANRHLLLKTFIS
ncbi:hypothetical protein ACS0TY_024829 [Phlomoides rotata]